VSIEKRGDAWRARYRGPDGRERNRSFRRKIDAERWLTEQRSRMTRGEWVDPAAGRVTFGELAAEWLSAAAHLKPKTRNSYRALLRTRVLPTWERVPVAKITHDAVAGWVAGMVDGGLSASRVRQAAYVVSAVCEYAVRTGRIARSPVTGVKLPRAGRHTERVFLDHAQVAALAAAAAALHPAYGVFVRLLAYTGLRWGEATALRARDVDLRRGRLDVRRAFSDVGGRLIEGTPKTHQQRTIPVAASLRADLAPLLTSAEPDALVFTTLAGTALRMSNFRRRVWTPAVTATRLTGLTPHGLRHTAASLYIAAGTPPKVVQRILGHASSRSPWTSTATSTRTRWTPGPTASTASRAARCGQSVAKTPTTMTRIRLPRRW
jgi:integrase